MEGLLTVLALEDRWLPPNVNYETPDPECDLDCVPNVARKASIDIAMSNSFGLGGQNASIIIARYKE